LHDRIISVRGEVWAHKTSLASPLFIEVHVPSQESARSFLNEKQKNTTLPEHFQNQMSKSMKEGKLIP
jgi:hypothetical protein